MTLAEQMESLSQNILQSYDKRMTDINETRHTTKNLLEESLQDRQSMAKEQNQQLRDYVANLRRSNANTLRERKSSRKKKATQQRQELRTYTKNLRHNTKAYLKEQHAAHVNMSATRRRQRSEDQAKLVAEVAQLRNEYRSDQQAAEQNWHRLGQSLGHRRTRKLVALPAKPKTEPVNALQLVPPRLTGTE